MKRLFALTILAVLAFGAHPAGAQVFDTAEATVADLQAGLAALTARVADLEAAPATWPAHGVFYLNALPSGPGNACSMALADVTVACPPDITDLEGDDADVAISCTSGSHDGTTYTATEAGEHICQFMASDPRWSYASHNSVATITVTP